MLECPYIPHTFGEALQDLYRRAGGWLTAAVHTSIAWPTEDVMLHYDGEDFFLRAARREEGRTLGGPCITMRCHGGQEHEVLNKVYRFASVLGWFQNGYVDVVGHITGSRPVLYSAGIQPFMPVTVWGAYGFNSNHMPLIRDDNTRRALAFWREGLRLEHVHGGYAFLSFFKVIESQFEHSDHRVRWIEQALTSLSGDAKERVDALISEGIDVGRHIFESGRCAVAHASLGREVVDPDIPSDRIRLAKDLVVVKALAESYIREELVVPDCSYVHRHRDRLQPLYAYLRSQHVDELKRGGSVLRRKLGLSGLRVSVNQWPRPVPEAFRDLLLSVDSAHDGHVWVRAEDEARTLVLMFVLDFTTGRAHTQLEHSGFLHPSQGGVMETAVAYLEYYKAVLGNGIIEITLPNGERVDCEVVIPVNIDLRATFKAVDAQIVALREQTQSEAFPVENESSSPS